MIPKSGNRFSEKIMVKQRDRAVSDTLETGPAVEAEPAEFDFPPAKPI